MENNLNYNKGKLLEQYTFTGAGYNPFLIRSGWQVAKLNFTPEQAFDAIHKLDMHLKTDEVFILFRGNAILITAVIMQNHVQFECEKMKEGIVYNIPKNVWHNIAMKEDAEVFIIEKDNTHLGDFAYHSLKTEEIEQLQHLMALEVAKQKK
ncbi:MAG: hypothetical protein AAGI07_16610 [Bacteroidota bacterium]